MRKFAILGAVLLFTATMSIAANANDRVVKIRGDEKFVPDRLIKSNFRFAPGLIRVKSGRSATWVNTTEDEHTVTIVDEEDVPADFDGVFECRDPGGVCRGALDGHFGSNPPVPVLNAGAQGLDTPGDSLLILPDESVRAVVSAPAGTDLYFVCSVHPWMQGEIEVV